jgi:hypothetical protein
VEDQEQADEREAAEDQVDLPAVAEAAEERGRAARGGLLRGGGGGGERETSRGQDKK